MFDRFFRKNRKRVQAVLANRVNKRALDEMTDAGRELNRSQFCKVVFLSPKVGRTWNLEQTVPVVGHDINTNGLAVIYHEPIETDHVLIGLPGEGGDLKFVQCEVRHTTNLGFGYYKIGLYAEHLTHLEHREAETVQRIAEAAQQSQVEDALAV